MTNVCYLTNSFLQTYSYAYCVTQSYGRCGLNNGQLARQLAISNSFVLNQDSDMELPYDELETFYGKRSFEKPKKRNNTTHYHNGIFLSAFKHSSFVNTFIAQSSVHFETTIPLTPVLSHSFIKHYPT